MLLATPPPPSPPSLPAPPVVERPVSHQVSYGILEGRAAPGAERVVVRLDGRVVETLRLRGRSFRADLDLPPRELTLRVETIDARGRRAARPVRNVFGLPRAARPRNRAPRLDERLQRDVRRLAGRFPGTAGIYVENLATGKGAAWNARATFPGASTLKLAIAVTLLGRVDGPPAAGTTLDGIMRGMLIASDNDAANRGLVYLGGSTSGGGGLVNTAMRAIGLERTEMYGGYLLGTSLEPTREPTARGIPVSVLSQPSWGVGKATTAVDLAELHRAVWLASAGLGPLGRPSSGVDPAEARYVMYLLAHSQTRSKLARVTHRRRGVVVLHKAGWIDAARHDAGLVISRHGIVVAAVMTYRASGPGRRADILAGDVAEAALRRLRG